MADSGWCTCKPQVLLLDEPLAGLAAADRRVFALDRGTVFHQGPAEPLLTDLDYRKRILWL